MPTSRKLPSRGVPLRRLTIGAAVGVVLLAAALVHGAAARYARTADEALRDHAIYNAVSVAANYRRRLADVAGRIGGHRTLPMADGLSSLMRDSAGPAVATRLAVLGSDTLLTVQSYGAEVSIPLPLARSALFTPYPRQVLVNMQQRLAAAGHDVPAQAPIGVRMRHSSGSLLFSYGTVAPQGRYWSATAPLVGVFPGEVEFLIMAPAVPLLLPYGVPPAPWTIAAGAAVLVALVLGAVLLALHRAVDLANARLEFAATVSHEVRTPLANIQLFAETLLLERADRPEHQRLAARTIAAEAARLRAMVENVLVHGRIDHRIDRRPESIRGLLAEVLAPFAQVMAQRGLTIEAKGPDPDVVAIDATAFRQVLVNLVDNAIRHGPDGQRVVIDCAHRGDFLVVRISDEGPGLSAEHREALWRPYERGAGGGAGLGLAVVRSMARAHGGDACFVDAPVGVVVEVTFAVRP